MAALAPFVTVRGFFYRAVLAERVERVLAPPEPTSAGRYHRLGEPALYLTASAEWAYIAISGYMREDGLPRVIVPVEIDAACVLDQRDVAACAALGIDRDASNLPWRLALERDEEPSSRRNADIARAVGADGIIDRSRHIPGGWHVILFRWNELGGPAVQVCGEPTPAVLTDSANHWG